MSRSDLTLPAGLSPHVYRPDEPPALPAPLEFVPCTDYTTFRAEHAFKGDDVVFHFYRTAENPGEEYWTRAFAEALEEVAVAHYAGAPRVQASLTRDAQLGIDSWWMVARGFADVGQPLKKIAAFYAALDSALDKRIV